jgi:cytoskeleton protein RodZ
MSDASVSAAPDDDGSVGNRLKQARVDKGLALEQAAEELRLSPDVLSALEADQFDILGAQVFVRGHLRQYAQLLGLDADDVMRAYSVEDHPNADPIVGLQPTRLRDGGDLRVWLSLGGVVLVMVALLIWWLTSPDGDTAVSAIGPTTSSLESAPPPVVQAPVREPETADEDTTPVEMTAAGSALAADTPAASIASVVDVVADETELPVAGTFSVEITFDEDCWVEIIGGDDRRLFYGLGRAGARSRFEASSPMSVLLGNVDGVRIAINGAAYPTPVGSRQGNLARFVVVAP